MTNIVITIELIYNNKLTTPQINIYRNINNKIKYSNNNWTSLQELHVFVNIHAVSSSSNIISRKKMQNLYYLNLLKFEEAAKEVVDEITRPRPEGEEDVHDIQVVTRLS